MNQLPASGIPDRLALATEILDAYIVASAQRDRYLLHSKYIDGVKGQAVLARGTIDRLKECVAAGIPLDAGKVRDWQESAHEALTSVARLESPDPNLEAAIKSVSDESKDLLSDARERWRSMVDEAVVPVQSYLEMAVRLQDHAATQKARSSQAQVQRLRSTDPSPGARQLMEQAVAEATEGLRSLIGDHPAVREFVKAACSGGAPLEDLDGAVERWLGESGMRDKFRVVYGAAPGTNPA